MPRTIPQIRERLHELADEHGIAELAELAEETKRRPPVRRAARTSRSMSPELASEIVSLAQAYPEASYKELAEAADTTIGRISEALAGKRDAVH